MPVSTRVSATNIAKLTTTSLGTTLANLIDNVGVTFGYEDNTSSNSATYDFGIAGGGSNYTQLSRVYLEFDLASYTTVTIDNAYLRIVLEDVDGATLSQLSSNTGFRINCVSSPDVHVGGITASDWTDGSLGTIRFAENDKGPEAGSSRQVIYLKLSSSGLSQLQTDAAAGGTFRIQLRAAADIDDSDTNLDASLRYKLSVPSGDSGAGGNIYSDVPQLILGMDQAEQINLRNGLVNAWNFETTGAITDDEGGDGLVSSGTNSLVSGPTGDHGSANRIGPSAGKYSSYTLSQALPITLHGWSKVVSGSPDVLDWADSDSASATKPNLNLETGLTVRDNVASRTRTLPIHGSITYGDPEDYPTSFTSWRPWAIRIDSSGMVEYRLDDSPWMFDDRTDSFDTIGLYGTFLNGVNRLAVGICGASDQVEIDHLTMWSRALNDSEVNSLFAGNAWPFDVLAAESSIVGTAVSTSATSAAGTLAAQESSVAIIPAGATIAPQSVMSDLLEVASIICSGSSNIESGPDASLMTIAAQQPPVGTLLTPDAFLAGASAGYADPDAAAATLAGAEGDDPVLWSGQLSIAAPMVESAVILYPGDMAIESQVIPTDLDWCPDSDPSLPGGGYPDACDLDLEAQLIDMTVDTGSLTIEAQAIAGGDVNAADLVIAGQVNNGQELEPSLLAFTVPRIVDIDFYRVYIKNEALTGNVGTATQHMLDERTTSPFTGTLTNELDATVLKADLDAVQLVVYDKKQKVVLRETRDALEFIEADGDVDWLITPHETSLVNPDVPDSALLTHIAVWEFCWGSHVIDTASIGFATTLDSRTVTVTHQFHGFQPEDYVIFKGAPEVGGLEMDGVFVVHRVTGGHTYEVEHVNKAASTASETRTTEFYWNPMTTKHAFEFIVRKREAQ